MTQSQRFAVVTGASRGIGRVLTERLVGSGYRVAAIATSVERLANLAIIDNVVPLGCDVANVDAVSETFDAIASEFGAPDLLINNAGVSGASGLTWESDPQDWWRVFEVNVRGTYLPTRAVVPGMLARGSGRIINVSSGAAYFPTALDNSSGIGSHYMASKAAVLRFTEAVAGELVGTGVSVFAVSPGTVKTDMTASLFGSEWDNPDLWTEPGAIADLVEFIDSGAVDQLSGRFLHASSHDWRALPADIDALVQDDRLTLRMMW